ncbi:hypothetical protein KPK_A0113 (plasmid) [Klebsiella variicola]|uniref:Uncharacterized protein n=1 Tax=Klebsiella variicola (strain 342) TaxID=507522 RepID=B5RK37_KLEV3|nr:hypothetical protein KPK_A0113 [Klebsiella variicola]
MHYHSIDAVKTGDLTVLKSLKMSNLKTRTLQKSYQTTHDLHLSHLTNITGFYQNQQGLFS